MTLRTETIIPSDSVAAAAERFMPTLGTWVQESITRYDRAPATDVHDQGTFTTGWEPYIRHTNDATALAFLKRQRDKIRDHFVESGQWRHGYWTMQEAHHGTEHYELFLGMLWRLDPDDPETIRQIVDVAEHLGNWSPEVEAWFDWESGLYRSFLFGADGVQHTPGSELNVPDHLRCVNIVLLAHRATGEQRYLDLAAAHGRQWAAAIVAAEELPIGLLPARVVYQFAPEEEAIYRARVGQGSSLATPLDRAESFLASDAVNAFLYLWKTTNETRFRSAAERLLDILAVAIAAPDAGVVADAIRHYRCWTGDTRYDAHVTAAVDKGNPANVQSIAFDPEEQLDHRPDGVGKRQDMLLWREDGKPRRHNPITLALAAEIKNDEQLATQALDLAHAYFILAQQNLPDGHHHGCAARTISAVARGHGRENHAGMTTAVLGPLVARFWG